MSDEYIKREDAINTVRNTFTGMTADTLELRINDIPSADVAPVVRCKDCKRCHRFADDSNSNMKSWCLKFSLSKRVNDNDFCALGEREDND